MNGLLKKNGKFGDYDVVSLLGKGGMAEVYLIRSPKTGAYFAAKILSDVPDDEKSEARVRFAREADAAMRITHPNLVKVYDIGEDPDTGLCYIIMDYLGGGTLSQRLAHGGSLPISEAVAIIAQLADALASAHDAGIVHRDIKPDNIMFDSRGVPKILDLGIAKMGADQKANKPKNQPAAGQMTPDVTMAGMLMGTPAYMAPEQVADSRSVDSRADIYSLGIVFYEMLSGVRPNPDDTVDELIDKADKKKEIPDIRLTMPEVSDKLAKVVSGMCATERDARPANAREVVRLLMATDEGAKTVPPEIAARAKESAVEKTLIRKTNVTRVDVPELFPEKSAKTGGKPAAGNGVAAYLKQNAATAVASGAIGLIVGIGIGAATTYNTAVEDAPPQFGVELPAEREVEQPEEEKEVVYEHVTVTNSIVKYVTITNYVDIAEAPSPTQAPAADEEKPTEAEKPTISAEMLEGKDARTRVELAAKALFPGWAVSGNHEKDDSCGYRAKKFGKDNVLVTLPEGRGKSVILEKLCEIPSESPVLHVAIAPHSQTSQFRLTVRIDKDEWHTDVEAQLGGIWNDIYLPLDKWRGRTAKIQLRQEPTGWHDEYAYWNAIEILSDRYDLARKAQTMAKAPMRKRSPLASPKYDKLAFETVAENLFGKDIAFKLQGKWRSAYFYEEEYMGRYNLLALRKNLPMYKASMQISYPKDTIRKRYYNPRFFFSVISEGAATFTVKAHYKGQMVIDKKVADTDWSDFEVFIEDLEDNPEDLRSIPKNAVRIEISADGNATGAIYISDLRLVYGE